MKRAWIAAIVLLALIVGIDMWTAPLERAYGQTKQAAAKNKTSKRANAKKTVTVRKCQIKLIDQVELAAARSGIIAYVEPQEGDSVQAEQTVARLKDELVRAQLATAKKQADNDVEIRYAEAATEFAKVDLQKLLETNKKLAGSIPDIDIKEKRLGVEKAKLQIEQAKWQQEVSESKAKEMAAALDQFGVIAPIDGIVTKVHKAKGEAVREGDVILEITNTHRLKVEGYLHYKDAWEVKQGDLVSVRLETDDDAPEAAKKTFQGRIKFVDVEVSAVAEDVLIWAEVENVGDVLRAGLHATMVIDLNRAKKPQAASR